MIDKIKNDKRLLIIILSIVAVILVVLYFLFRDNDKNNKIEIVESSSKFYTVSNCVSKYLNYWYVDDSDNLFILLDDSYIKDNKINRNNLLEKIGKLDTNFSFEAHKMYQEKLSKYLTKYYVQGYLIEENMDGIDYNGKKDFYIIVYLDEKNSTFSIAPYDGDLFINGGL